MTLAQLNTEHCEIVKELVMQRLKNEEMESELVRYKLLCVVNTSNTALSLVLIWGCMCVLRYAEAAMQQNEEALSHRRSILTARGDTP